MRRRPENMWNKVQRFSIRKFSFGVTSALVGTFFLANASMVQAEVESGQDSAVHTTKPEENIGTGKPNENAQPAVATEDKKVDTNVVTEETEKASKEQATDVAAPKADKSTLSQAVDTLSELLNQVNLNKVSRTSMLEYEGVLSKAKEVFQNDAATQLEVDAQVVKVNSAITIAKSFPKVKSSTGETVAPKTGKDETVETPKTETEIKHSLETVKADLQKYVKKSEIPTDKPNVTAAEEILENISKQLENTTLTSKELTALLEQAKTVRNTLVNEDLRATSGARDSRNNQKMGEGVSFRANDVRVEGPLYNVKEYISEDKFDGGGTTLLARDRTINKTFMTARYSKEGNKKFITYDVYFQNDGYALNGSRGNAFWFYPPRDILYKGGNYVGDTIAEAYYERYRNHAGTGRLSDNPGNFTKVDTYNALEKVMRNRSNQDDSTRRQWRDSISLYQLDGGPNNNSKRQEMLKDLENNPDLNRIIRLNNDPNGSYPDLSYSHVLTVSGGQNYAYKYHVKLRLKDDVTAEQAKTAGTMAVTAKEGKSTTATQAYVYAASGTSLLAPPTINTLTKYDGTLVSTDRVISGTGEAGATITLTMQDGTSRSIPVNNSGRWSYTLKQNEKLTQNTRQDASIKSPNTISAKQTKNGEESSATSVNVQLARAISIDTPLQAGRDISVKVAHDTGRFYIQVRNAANTNSVYEYGVIQENGRWRIENSTAANAIDVKVTDGDTPSEKKITLHVNDAHRKNNIPFKITKDHVVRVRSHHVHDANIAADPGHENDGWVTANKATNTDPTITINNSNATYTSDGTLTKDKLKTLVTVNDAEDTPGRTVGNTAAENLDVTATKDGKNVDFTKPLKQGTYNLTYRTTDAAGATATKNHTITVNYAAVAKSKINLVQGESVSDEIKRSLLELRDGNDKVAIPNNARVEVTLDTSAKADSKTAVASVVLQGKTIASTNINYRVLPTFPIAHTVYDFKGVNRSDDESKYYVNTGIPGGMKWFAKRGNEAEIDASGLRNKINADPVGETTYKFGGKYNYGRFTDSPQPNEKLEHAATFTHKVFDIKPNDTKVTVAQGGTLSEAQAISAVAKVTGSPDLPSGTTYEWVDDRGNKITPTANTAGVQNFKVKVTLPPAQIGDDAPEATKRQPSKIIDVPVNVTPPAPTVTTEPRYSGTLVSTDRSISGRGIPGATITVALQDGTTGTTTVNNQGEWTYNLKTNEKLTQNTKKDASIKADKEISVKQSKDGVESSATSVDVQLARVISINTPVQAGREITVKVPHDAGQFYVQLNYDTRQVYEYGVKQENGQWKITDPNKANTTELIVKDGDNVSEKELTLRIKDSNKKTNIPFTIPAGENKLRVRVHHVNRQNNPANPANETGQGWIIASEATNESPTITMKEPTKTAYTADGSLTMDGLKKLATVADKEDDADKTVGNRASDNFTVTVKQGANVVDLSNNKYLKKGTYTLTYTTRDAAGATATKEHTITVNYTAEAKPTINLIQGETLTEAEKRSLLQLQDGTSKIDVPSDARVEVTLDTSSESNGRTASATVVFADNTRTAPININYKVYKNFETVTKVYDFAGVGRNDSPASYYLNPGGLPGGMSWVVKRDNDAAFKNADADMKNMLNADGVGTTTYKFGAKYPRGRFTDNPSEAEKLSYTPTFTHEVFDVGANTTRVMVKSGTALADSQAKDAVMAVNGSATLPDGTTYEWVNQDGTPLANKTVTEKGEATRYVKVTLPKVSETGPNANKVRSSKIVAVTINESEKPKVSLDGSELSTDARNENSKFVIFRGATFDPTFRVSDNTGKVTEVKASGLPSGREFVKNTDTPNGNVQLTGDQITDTSNATLGDHIGKVLVKDASGNEQEYQFKYTVVDIKVVENPKTVPINTKLNDSHFHVKLVNSDATDATSQEGLYPTNTKFKWKKETNEVSNETQLSEPGKITGYKAVVESPAARAGFYTKNGVKTYMPASIERDITFLVKPNDIIRYSKNGDDVDKTTTTHTVDPETGKITPTPNTVTHQKDGAKDTVVTQTIPVTTRYEPDPTKDVGTNTVVNNGSEGSIVTTTPKLVNEITGEVTNGVPVVRKTEMVPKVVKVGTKPKVVETPIEKPVRYEADPTRPKGEKTTETEGKDGKIVKTTPYIVNSDGSVTEGETTSVRTEPKEKVVKVGTQPKVETKVIPIETTYQEDPTKEVGNNEIIDNGSEGRVVTTTPYIVNDKTGEVTEGQPRVERTEMRPKVVKVGTKEAKRIPTVDVEQDPKTGDVTVTPKKPDGTPYKPGTKVEIPGKDGPITVTIGEDGKGKVPNSDLPEGKVSGPGKITEPNKPAVEVPKVETPAKVTPETPVTETPDEIEITQQPNGNAIVTPKKPDGKPYPSGSKVVIPGENNTPITVTIGNDGSGEVPNDNLPKKAVPGTGTVTEPNQKPSQPVDVTTPARKTPTLDVEQNPKTGDVTVTPKKPDGSTYPPGTTVEIPGKDKDHPITVTIEEGGKGKVPNSELPEGKVPGTGKITEPAKPAVEVPVETPAKVTPTVELDQDPKTGDVTVTPKRPDGTTYPPGTKVEIPGKNGTPIVVIIGEDGKGKVPNSELPEGKVPGTGKITEPGKPTVEVPGVTTPGKFTPGTPVTPTTPETPTTEQPGKIEIHQKPNGDAVVTPKKPDGSTYPPGTKVEIPGENGTTIVVTIGDNGSGEVPNDKLPKKDIPGTGTVTEPNKRPSKPVDVTTPARKTPTSDLEQNPKTSDESETSKDNQTPAQETPATTGKPVQQTQDTNQNILPNTGTADGLGIFSAAAASILSGLGLVVFGKKEDEEEENN